MPEKTFAQLVEEAPEATGAGIVNLVGVLGRSQDPKKFVLTLADGRALTLDMAAVRGHQVLAGATGQTVVRVALEASSVPQDALSLSPAYLHKAHTDPNTGMWDAPSTGLPDAPNTGLADAVSTATGLADQTLAWTDLPGVKALRDAGLAPATLPPGNQPDPPPFSLAIPQAFQAMMAPQAAWWSHWHRPKVLMDGSYPFGVTPDI